MTENEKKVSNDIIDLLRLFVVYKYRILFVIILSLIISFYYLSNSKVVYESKIKLYPSSQSYLKSFLEINYIAGDNFVNQSSIKKFFIEEFKSQEILINNLKEFENASKDIHDNDYFTEARKFKIVLNKMSNPTIADPFAEIFFTSDEVSYDYKLKVISKTLREINKKISQKINQIYDLEIYKSNFIKKNQLERLNNDLSVAIFQHELELLSQISILEEQAAIARSLSISSVTSDVSDLPQNHNFIKSGDIDVGLENPYYLIGYEAIEKEIEQLENKEKSIEKLSPEINELKVEIMKVQKNNKVELMVKKLNQLKESNRDQLPIRYNLGDIEKETISTPAILVLLVIFVTMIILCFLIVIISHLLNLYKSRFSRT